MYERQITKFEKLAPKSCNLPLFFWTKWVDLRVNSRFSGRCEDLLLGGRDSWVVIRLKDEVPKEKG